MPRSRKPDSPENDDELGYWFLRWRRPILFFSGLAGIFGYLAITEFANKQFHFEWLIVFLAMMGVSLAQGIEG